MELQQVGLNLYTLRDYLADTKSTIRTFQRIREIGYEAVEVCSVDDTDDSELVRILDGEGLVCCGTHEAPHDILHEPRRIAERLQKLGCVYTAYPYPEGVDITSLINLTGLARNLDRAGAILMEEGCRLLYHNHNIEFQRCHGELVLEYLFDNTDPSHVLAEPDTYWVQNGGGDPLEWCRKLKNRMPILHMKDYVVSKNNDESQPGWEPTFAEVGSGNLDWRKIIFEAEASGCQWFVVEQDACQGDPFDSITVSFDYIKNYLIPATVKN